MKKLGLTLLAALIVIQAEALLPPLYQTSSEIKAILADEQLGQKLQSGEVIEKIEKNAQGYEITTNQHKLLVKVVYEHAKGPGPAHYKLLFDNATSLQ
jgi:hypothetical protein